MSLFLRYAKVSLFAVFLSQPCLLIAAIVGIDFNHFGGFQSPAVNSWDSAPHAVSTSDVTNSFTEVGLQAVSLRVGLGFSNAGVRQQPGFYGFRFYPGSSDPTNDAVASDAYIEFTLDPVAGTSFTLDPVNTFQFNQRVYDDDDSVGFFVRSSLDGFSSNIASVSGVEDRTVVNLSVLGFTAVNDAVTFRIYLYDSDGDIRGFSIRDNVNIVDGYDFQINGSVAEGGWSEDPELGDRENLLALLQFLADNEDHPLLRRHFASIRQIMLKPDADFDDTDESYDSWVAGTYLFMQNEGQLLETYVDNDARPLMMSFVSPTDGELSFYWLVLPEAWDEEREDYPFYLELHGSSGGRNDNPLRHLLRPLQPTGLSGSAAMQRRDGYYIQPWGRGDLWYQGVAENDTAECLADFDTMYATDLDRQYMYGFSMGGSGTLYHAVEDIDRWDAIGLYSPALLSDPTQEIANIYGDIPVWLAWGGLEGFIRNRSIMVRDQLLAAGNDTVRWFEIGNVGHRYLGEYQADMLEFFDNPVGTSPSTATTGVSIEPESADLLVGERVQIDAMVLPAEASNRDVSWSSSDESVATVNASGLVTGIGPGVATISATTVDGGFSAGSEVSVTGSGGSGAAIVGFDFDSFGGFSSPAANSWDSAPHTLSTADVANSFTDAGLQTVSLSVGAGFSGAGVRLQPGFYGFRYYPGSGAVDDASASDAYFEFTLEPVAGGSFTLDPVNTFQFNQRVYDDDGSVGFFVRSSLDGFLTNVDSLSGVSDRSVVSLNVSGFVEVSEAVTFRVYMYDGDGLIDGLSLRSAGDIVDGYDFVVNGSVEEGGWSEDPELGDQENLLALLQFLADTEDHPLLQRHFESMRMIMLKPDSDYDDTRHDYDAWVSGTYSFMQNEGQVLETYVDNDARPLMMAFSSSSDSELSFYWFVLPENWNESRDDYPFYLELHGSSNGRNDNPLRHLLRPLQPGPISGTAAMQRRDGYYIQPWGRGDHWYQGVAANDTAECLADFDTMYSTDPDRQFMYGFSMGGSGVWDHALEDIDRWDAIGLYSPALLSNPTQEIAGIYGDIPVWLAWGGQEGFIRNRSIMIRDLLIAEGNDTVKWSEIENVGHQYLGDYQVDMLEFFDNPEGTQPLTAVTGVDVDPGSADLPVGDHLQLEETVLPIDASNQDVAWTSSDPSVATVSDSGLVTGVALGVATITVTTIDGDFIDGSEITVVEGEGEPAVLPKVGMNWNSNRYFRSAYYFNNAIMNSQRFLNSTPSDLPLDATGYPTSLTGTSGGTGAVGIPLFLSNGRIYPTGDWVLEWDGTGELEFVSSSGPQPTLIESGQNRRVYNVADNSAGGFQVLWLSTSPAPDNVKNVRLWLPGTEDSPNLLHADIVADHDGMQVLRAMDLAETNNSNQVNWSDRQLPGNPTQGPVAWEHIVEMCNELQEDAWICVPHRATDDYVTQLARLIRDNLDPNLRVWIEYSNEVWNAQFSQTNWVNSNINPPGGGSLGERYAYRSGQIFDIFASEFGGLERIVRVCATHSSNQPTTQDRLTALAGNVDVLASTSYFGNGNTVRSWLAGNWPVTVPEFVNYLRDEDLPDWQAEWTQTAAIADSFGVDLVTYEGHCHVVGGGSLSAEINSWLANEFHTSAEIANLYRETLDFLMDLGLKTHMAYANYSTPGEDWWGHREYAGQPLSEAHMWARLLDWAEGVPSPSGFQLAGIDFDSFGGFQSPAVDSWDTAPHTLSTNDVAGSFTVAGLETLALSVGPGLSNAGPEVAAGIYGFRFYPGTEDPSDDATVSDAYFELTLDPVAGSLFTLDEAHSIQFRIRSSDVDGTSGLFVRSSLDGFSSNLDSVAGVADGALVSFDLPGFEAVSEAVTFRIYLYDTDGEIEGFGLSSGSNVVDGYDFVVNGFASVASVPVTGVGVAPESTAVEVGERVQLIASVVPANADDIRVSWSSSDESVATVNASGLVTGIGPGIATVSATTVDGGFSAGSEITVTGSGGSGAAIVGFDFDSFGGFSSPAANSWDSAPHTLSTADVANSFTDAGLQTVSLSVGAGFSGAGVRLQPGFYGFRYYPGSGAVDDASASDAYFEFTLEPVAGGSFTLDPVNTFQFNQRVYDDDGSVGFFVRSSLDGFLTNVDSLSGVSDRSVVSLNVSGFVEVSEAVTFRVYMYDGDGLIDGLSLRSAGNIVDGYDFVVNGSVGEGSAVIPVEGVQVSPETASIEVGQTRQLSASVSPLGATDASVSWSSSDAGVATVDSAGVVAGVGVGSAVVTATTSDGGFTDSTTVEVSVSTNSGLPIVGIDFDSFGGFQSPPVNSWDTPPHVLSTNEVANSFTASGLQAVSLSAGSGFSGSGVRQQPGFYGFRFYAGSGDPTDDDVASDAYFEFTIDPIEGSVFSIDSANSLQFSLRVYDSDGTAGLFVRSSIDGFATNLDSVIDFVDGGVVSFDLPGHKELDDAVTFRVYMYDTDGDISGFSLRNRGDIVNGYDFVVNGTVETTLPLSSNIEYTREGGAFSWSAIIEGGHAPYSISWDFGDGGSSTENEPVHIYNEAGAYAVGLSVTDDSGVVSNDSLTVDVTQLELPEAMGNLRVATFNASLSRALKGELATALASGMDEQVLDVAEVIQRSNPDILLINEFDLSYNEFGFDESATQAMIEDFKTNYLETFVSEAFNPIFFTHTFVAPVNAGVPSGFDLNNDGDSDDPEDAFGYGTFPGQGGMLLLSKYSIDLEHVRTFQYFRWKDMPGALLPADPNDSDGDSDLGSYYTDEELSTFRLASKSLWDIPVKVDGATVHLLASQPTPVGYDDGTSQDYPDLHRSDWNGLRNHDEIRFWSDYIDPQKSSYVYSDSEWMASDEETPEFPDGGLHDGDTFIILGDLGVDPLDGDSTFFPMSMLLSEPAVNGSESPGSLGAVEQVPTGFSKSETKTSSQYLRADYILPSASGIEYVQGFVFWPQFSDIEAYLLAASDHRLVAADLIVEADRMPGDFNGDGSVNLMDLQILMRAFRSKVGDPGYLVDVDLDQNGVVDFYDHRLFLRLIPSK